MLRDEGGKPWQLPTCQVAGGWGEDPSRLGPTSDAIRVQIGPGDCSILPLPLLEMFHEFSIIRNFCRKQGCWGGFLYHAFSRIRIFFPETLRWLSPLIHPHIIWGPAGFVFVQSVSIDLNFSWWVLTSLPPLEGLLFIPPKLQNWSSLQSAETLVPPPQPSHSSRGTGGNWSTDLLLHHGSQPS